MMETKNQEKDSDKFAKKDEKYGALNSDDFKNKKSIVNIENLLCLFIILCPFFDILSFITRNILKSNVSISTFIRPIIPVFIGIYIFIKSDKKEKKFFTIISLIYILYGVIHLYIMKSLITGCSYGNVIGEMQYILNYTFLIIYFIIYVYSFTKGKSNINEMKTSLEKLRNSIVIMNFIYIVSIYFSILIGKSSPTYTETGLGYKGFIESGNSLSAILILSMFVTLYVIKNNFDMLKNARFESNKKEQDTKSETEKNKKETIGTQKITKKNVIMFFIAVFTYLLTSLYLITLIGTRTGLIGTILVLFVFMVADVIINKNKKVLVIGIAIISVIGLIILFKGSNTIKRRKEVDISQYEIIDEKTGEIGTMTGDMLKIKNKIIDNELEEGYMSNAQKQSVIDLYNYTKKHKVNGVDSRKQQLMYNIFLVKNQKNICSLLFGNGFKTNFREMVMENEFASMILNFGLLGFILYMGPFIATLIYSVYEAIKNRKIDFEYVILQSALGLSFVLSWMSGYVFFATSCMIVIVVISTILLCKIKID